MMDDSVPLDSAERRFVHRETVALAVLMAIAIGSFFLTRTAAMANHRTRTRDAAAWYGRGLSEAAAAHHDAAVAALNRAAGLDRDNFEYRLALGRVLTAAHQEEAARRVLLGAREQAPEDAQVNLQLARTEVARGDTTAAEKYYHNALYGSWTADEGTARRGVRTELIRYLLARGERKRALSELMVLSGNLPDEPVAQIATARMFLAATDPRQALEHFERGLARAPDNGEALAGAGEAAFALEDYPIAVRYLRAAPLDPRLAELRRTAEHVLSDDPLRGRLSPAERRQRAVRGLEYAAASLDACPAAAAGSPDVRGDVDALAHALTPRALRERPDIIDDAVGLVVRAVGLASDTCGGAPSPDRTWRLIGRLHAVDPR